MPIILGPTGAPVSSPQTVVSSVVYDYLTDTAGNALVGSKIQCTLNYSAGPTVASPAVSIGPVQQVTTTDGNGYWQFNLVPNPNISPANTTYTIQTPYTAYDITVGTTGPYQSTAVGTIVNTPAPLLPATTNLTGPITVTGNETVTGTLTVQGASTLQGGATVQNGETLTGGLTMTDAASRIISGATSISLRNNANSADNLLISNAGAATVRNGLTVTAGDETLTAGRLVLGASSSKIVPGATQLSLRNNADAADNILVADAGGVTLRNALSIPPSAGGTVVSSSYGSVPLKIAETVVGTPTATVTLGNPFATGFTHLKFYIAARSNNASQADNIILRLNNDSAANYYQAQVYGNNSAANSTAASGTANPVFARIPAATASASYFGSCEGFLPLYNVGGVKRVATSTSGSTEGAGAANLWILTLQIGYDSSSVITRVDFLCQNGLFVTNSTFSAQGVP